MSTQGKLPAGVDDRRFDEAEADVDPGEPWRFREPDAPNPLTLVVTGWSSGTTKLGTAEFMNGTDRDGKAWSVLVGSLVLKKRLIEGLVAAWSNDDRAFIAVETLGRAQPGEIVSIKYVGDVDGASYAYPNFRVSRKPLNANAAEIPGLDTTPASRADPQDDDDLPF